jgi:hypothetical protein
MSMQNFSSLACTQTDLDKYLTFFEEEEEACSQNFSFLALNTAELASPQISSKNRRQRRVTDGICFSL